MKVLSTFFLEYLSLLNKVKSPLIAIHKFTGRKLPLCNYGKHDSPVFLVIRAFQGLESIILLLIAHINKKKTPICVFFKTGIGVFPKLLLYISIILFPKRLLFL